MAPPRQLAITKIHDEATKNRTQMTLIVMINADFSWIIRVYHNYQRHLRSIVFVVYFFASYLSSHSLILLRVLRVLRGEMLFSG